MTTLYYESGQPVRIGDYIKKSVMTTRGGPLTGRGKVTRQITKYGGVAFEVIGNFKTISPQGFTGTSKVDYLSIYNAPYNYKTGKRVLIGYKKVKK